MIKKEMPRWLLFMMFWFTGVGFGQDHHSPGARTFISGVLTAFLVVIVVRMIGAYHYFRQIKKEQTWKDQIKVDLEPPPEFQISVTGDASPFRRQVKRSSPMTGMATTAAAVATATGTHATAPKTPETSPFLDEACSWGVMGCRVIHPRSPEEILAEPNEGDKQ